MPPSPSNLEKRANHAIICALLKRPRSILALRKIVTALVDAQDVWIVDKIQLSGWIEALLKHMESWKVVKQNSKDQWVWKGWDTMRGEAPDGKVRTFPARLKPSTEVQGVVR